MNNEDQKVVRCQHQACRMVQYVTTGTSCRRCGTPFLLSRAIGKLNPAASVERHASLSEREIFHKAIVNRRHELGLMQIEVSSRAGLPRSYISRMENGNIMPLWGVASRLLDVLKLGLAEIFGGDPASRFPPTELIKAWRAHVGISQADLESKTGVERCRISAYEHHHKMPMIEVLVAIARGLNIPFGKFLEGPPVVESQAV